MSNMHGPFEEGDLLLLCFSQMGPWAIPDSWALVVELGWRHEYRSHDDVSRMLYREPTIRLFADDGSMETFPLEELSQLPYKIVNRCDTIRA